MKIAFDMSSVMWTSLLVGKDVEGIDIEFEGKMFHVNTAAYGYENAINLMVSAMTKMGRVPQDCILVFEGMNSKKRRTTLDPMYKAGRGNRPDEAYVEFAALKAILIEAWLGLGANAITQDMAEGDDTLAWLAVNAEEDLVIVSNDNDLAALNGTNAYGAKIEVRVNGEVGINKYGPFAPNLITTYKALVGDTSDGIKGCPGFGPAAFLKLFAKYDEDGIQEIQDMLERGSLKPLQELPECPLLSKLIHEEQAIVKCYKLAKMHPEWVDTVRYPLQWQAGMVKQGCKDERLKLWSGKVRLVGAAQYDAALKFLKEKLIESPHAAFDIETSTPDESTDWLQMQGNPNGVDVRGSKLTGFTLTFGANNQYTYYVTVDHKDSDNIKMSQVREMLEAVWDSGLKVIIQDFNFEGVVLYNAEDEDGTKWRGEWLKYAHRGFIPNMEDTKLMANYVNENEKSGLKQRALLHLGYQQADYATVTTVDGRQYKMRELTAQHVLSYGADDGITTAALYNFYKLHMSLEHQYHVYRNVEIDACYQHVKNFIDGMPISVAKIKLLESLDGDTYDRSWALLRNYLLEHGWEGTVLPVYDENITCKDIKQAYAIVTDADFDDDEEAEDSDEPLVKDPVLSTRVRTPLKMVPLIEAAGETNLAGLVQRCIQGEPEGLNAFIKQHFKGEPKFKFSSKQLCTLLYEVMGLEIRVRNKPTAPMKAAGIRLGNPKADEKAFAYALRDTKGTPLHTILEAMRLMRMVLTRRGLYYNTYPYFVHWKTGLVHSSHNQAATNTRRASSSGPNLTQLPKNPKIEGEDVRFREAVVPHKPDAVVVSMDFMAQELRVIAHYSQDENLLACYIGDNLKDMHSLTGLGIMQVQPKHKDMTYEDFVAILEDSAHPLHKEVKEARVLGKKVNFTTEYGAMAPKLALTMLIEEQLAQRYIDAREDAFPGVVKWKEDVINEAKAKGFVTTLLGARRHLAAAFNSDDAWDRSKAERQSVNFKVQSSSAEMTKLAEGRMWKDGLFFDFDAVCYSPIHDEVVASVLIKDLPEFLPRMHACMVAPYGGMTVPVTSSISFGPSFGVQFEASDQPRGPEVSAAFLKYIEHLKESGNATGLSEDALREVAAGLATV